MPTALFVHGMLADRRVWRDVVPELPGLECMFVELPSHGAAVPWDGSDYQTQAYRMVEAACANGPVHLVGHSFGAMVALRLAVERPDLLLSLTLIEPVFFYSARQAMPDEFKNYQTRAQPVMAALDAGEDLRAAQLFLADWGVKGTWAAIPEEAREKIASQMPLIAASAASLVDDTGNIWARLGGISCKVMLVIGGQSEGVMQAVRRGLEAQMNIDVSEVFSDAGHMIPVTHGKALGRQIARFTS